MKECPYCKSEISTDAIKCPNCREWLNKTSLSFKNPFFSGLIILLIGILFMNLLPRYLLGKNFSKMLHTVKFSESSGLQIAKHKIKRNGKSFSIIGELENNDKFPWESISILAVFKDKNNEVSSLSSTYISKVDPNSKRAFEVNFGCSDSYYDPKQHASYTIEIEEAIGKPEA